MIKFQKNKTCKRRLIDEKRFGDKMKQQNINILILLKSSTMKNTTYIVPQMQELSCLFSSSTWQSADTQ